jgi:pilus assembly protein CpaB
VGRRILAILAATVIALIGALLVLFYARGADERAVAAASPTTVYVTALPVPAGTSLKEAVRLEQVVETQTAASAVPAGALTTVDASNSALLALTDIPPGQYVLAASFGETPVGEQRIQVPAGQLAVSLALSDPARVGNFVTAGSYVTIFATHTVAAPAANTDGADDEEAAPAEAAEGARATSVLLDNLQVIAMGDNVLTQTQPTTPQEGEVPPPATPAFLVTLAVTPEQAAELVHGINSFQLYAGLRGAEVTVNPNLSVTDETIFRVVR